MASFNVSILFETPPDFEVACRNADQIYLNKWNKKKPKDQRLRRDRKKD